ncbi:MAG TPA: hypothetical protein VH740_01300 [Vicinamibacterales bacterium]|jgi:hypothetical protein
MKHWLALPVAALFLAVFAFPSSPSSTLQAAGAAKVATGTVSSVTADSITIKDKSNEWKLSVDAKTAIVGKGFGTKMSKMKEEKKTPHVNDFIQDGDMVTAKYDDASKHATEVKLVRAAKPIK